MSPRPAPHPAPVHGVAVAADAVPGAAPVAAKEALPADLTKLKVPELKQLCRDRGLKVGGNKPELIARLEG